jgi:hypothetical protein
MSQNNFIRTIGNFPDGTPCGASRYCVKGECLVSSTLSAPYIHSSTRHSHVRATRSCKTHAQTVPTQQTRVVQATGRCGHLGQTVRVHVDVVYVHVIDGVWDVRVWAVRNRRRCAHKMHVLRLIGARGRCGPSVVLHVARVQDSDNDDVSVHISTQTILITPYRHRLHRRILRRGNMFR